MKVANPVYLNADRTKAVPAGHPEAAFLFIGRNGTVKDEDAKKYGITEQGAKDQGKDESGGVIFKAGVTASTPDGVNTAPDAPQAIPLAGRVGLEADTKSVTPRKTVEPESAPTTGKKARG